MAICDLCMHEYPDSYDECPFCARRAATRERIMSENAPVRRHRVSPVLIGVLAALASMTAVVAYLVIHVVLGASAIPGASRAVSRQVCLDNQRTVERLAGAYEAEFGLTRLEDPALLVGSYLERPVACPRGGHYLWDAEKATLACSVHGWHGHDASGSP